MQIKLNCMFLTIKTYWNISIFIYHAKFELNDKNFIKVLRL